MKYLLQALKGSLVHEDSLVTMRLSMLEDIECIAAGTGIAHSKFICLQTEPFIHKFGSPEIRRIATKSQDVFSLLRNDANIHA